MESIIKEIDFNKSPYDIIIDLKDLVYRIEKENEELKNKNKSDGSVRYQTMNKQELLENYTMEQLADMAVNFQDKGKAENPEITINCPVCGTPFEFNDGKSIEITPFETIINADNEEDRKILESIYNV